MDKVKFRDNECATLARDVREAMDLSPTNTADLLEREPQAMAILKKIAKWPSEDRMLAEDDFRTIRQSLIVVKDYCNVQDHTDSFHQWLGVFEAFLNVWEIARKRRA